MAALVEKSPPANTAVLWLIYSCSELLYNMHKYFLMKQYKLYKVYKLFIKYLFYLIHLFGIFWNQQRVKNIYLIIRWVDVINKLVAEFCLDIWSLFLAELVKYS